MSILCATDFSPLSDAAIVVAGLVSTRSNDEVTIAHALDLADPSVHGRDFGEARRHAEQQLRASAARFEATAGRPARTLLLYGEPADAVAELASLRGTSLVLAGSRGHPTSPLRSEGISERMAQRTTVPLVVVRDVAPFIAWARGERPLRVLLGVDRGSSWEGSLHWVNRLREVAPCDVTIAQVYYPHDERQHYGLPRTHALAERDPEVEALLVRAMESRIALRGQGKVEFRPIVGVGRLGDHLVESAHLEGSDLIALGTHRKSGLLRYASVANVALHYAHASVLLVPPPLDVIVPRHPRCILAATDLSPAASRAVAHAYALVEDRAGSEVVLLHVDDGRASSDGAALVERLRQLVPEHHADKTRIVVERDPEPGARICVIAERAGADVVCVGSHGRGGHKRAALGSVANDVVRRSHRPVLVVRTSDD